MTTETRSGCRRCRLKKCLESGMDPQLIRCPPKAQTSSMETRQPMTRNEKQLQLPMVSSSCFVLLFFNIIFCCFIFSLNHLIFFEMIVQL